MKQSEPIDSIRLATPNDVPVLLEIFANARQRMADAGNPHQWVDGYPSEALIREDIARGDCFACFSKQHLVATFVLRTGNDPTYDTIYHGHWPNSRPYATIHRIASNGKTSGVLHQAVCFALTRHDTIRIDTHRDNLPMQRAMAKEGFIYCGIIHCWNGDERMAFQLSQIGH